VTREFAQPALELGAAERDPAHDLRWLGMLATSYFQPHPEHGGGELTSAQADRIRHLNYQDRRPVEQRLADLLELLDRAGVLDRTWARLRSLEQKAEDFTAESRRRRGDR
jgi:hypothetical protein